MATLLETKTGRPVPLLPATSVGSAPECVLRPDAKGLPAMAARIVFDRGCFRMETADRNFTVLLNGRAVRRAELSEGDTLCFGDAEYRFTHFPPQPLSEAENRESRMVEALHTLSVSLMAETSLDGLLDTLLTQILSITGAEKGFILMREGEAYRLCAARNIEGRAMDDCNALSRCVIERVAASREAALITGGGSGEPALSESLVNLQVRSVIAAPMICGGELLGVLYAGTGRAVSLFDRTDLRLLTLFAGQAALLVRNFSRIDSLASDNARLREAVEPRLIYKSATMENVLRTVARVAQSTLAVLVGGETGTGKELVAREIHRQSARSLGPFVAINCSAIPENLFESELFGHCRGAFTGAVTDRPGRFTLANNGTLFLDEVGDLPAALQAKLLRILETGEVEPLGGSAPVPVDVRVVAASNRSLRSSGFRNDLYYRLAGVEITVPPLRERGLDAVYIARAVLSAAAAEQRRAFRFTKEAESAILQYPWPGNVRELRNRVLRAAALAPSEAIEPGLLELGEGAETPVLPLADAKERFSLNYIREILLLNHNDKNAAARDLNIDPRTVYRYLENDAD